jgi:HlyD family type I secretion membrane fusion protein
MSLQLANPSKLPAVRRRSTEVGEVIGAFESDTIAVFVRTSPVNEHIILYVIVAMVVLAVVLSAIVRLDRVVTSVAGYIIPTGGELYVDPLDQGIIRQVNVKPGEVVKKGQALATLDPTFTQADLLQLQQHLSSDEAAVAREEDELAGRAYRFSTADTYQRIQGEIWEKRQAQYRADLANFDGQIHSAEAQMSQAKSDAVKYEKRLKLAADAEEVYQPLFDKGYVSKLQVMQSTDARTEISRLLADAENQISQYGEMAAALKGQRESYIQNWYSTTSSQLVADRKDLDLTRDSLDKAQKLQDLTTLDAPEDAIVLKVGKVSRGSVALAGGQASTLPGQDPLFTLMPVDAPVEAEIDVATTDVGFIQVGDPVHLKLDAFPYIRHGLAKGVVKSISEGSFTVDINNSPVNPYFKVRVTITELRLRDVPPDLRLIPGMTLIADIMVGKRTILSYLTEGAMRTSAEAMREPN